MTCNNICLRVGIKSLNVNNKRQRARLYDIGYRFCKGCSRYFLTSDRHCPCCRFTLRIHPVESKYKNRNVHRY